MARGRRAVNSIPKHARIRREARGTVRADVNPERPPAHVMLYEGTASDGYATDYQARPARWLRVERGDGLPSYVRRFTGKNFEQGLAIYEDLAAAIETEGEG